MSPTTNKSQLSSTSTTSKPPDWKPAPWTLVEARAQTEDRNKAKGITKSSFNKMIGGGEEENLSPAMKRIMDFRRSIAMSDAENELEIERRFAPERRQLAREAEEGKIENELEIERRFAPRRRELARKAEKEEIRYRQRSPMVGAKYKAEEEEARYSQSRQRSPMVGTKYGMSA